MLFSYGAARLSPNKAFQRTASPPLNSALGNRMEQIYQLAKEFRITSQISVSILHCDLL